MISQNQYCKLIVLLVVYVLLVAFGMGCMMAIERPAEVIRREDAVGVHAAYASVQTKLVALQVPCLFALSSTTVCCPELTERVSLR